jgi:hypothetical protein
MFEGLYETQILGPSYVAKLDSGFTKAEVKEYILKIKNNKASGYDRIPAKFWKIRVFCTVTDGNETLTDMFNKIKNGK